MSFRVGSPAELHHKARKKAWKHLHQSQHISNSEGALETKVRWRRWLAILCGVLVSGSCSLDPVETCKIEKGVRDEELAVTCGFLAIGAGIEPSTEQGAANKPAALAALAFECYSAIEQREKCEDEKWY
jgi:hypothetical protein